MSQISTYYLARSGAVPFSRPTASHENQRSPTHRGTAQSWPNSIQYPVELQIPIRIDSPVRILPVYSDGLLCQMEPERCQYICRNEHGMRMHSKQNHGWTAQARKGRPSKISTINPTPKPWRTVTCQRFFVYGQGSHFIEIVNVESS